MSIYYKPDTQETRQAHNRLAREVFKMKLLAEIRMDMQICELEGWDRMEYINELRDLLNSLGGK